MTLTPEQGAVLAQALSNMANELERIVELFAPRETSEQMVMQARADFNRENAPVLFPELHIATQHVEGSRVIVDMYHDDDCDPVVFTPYGYRKAKEVAEHVQSDEQSRD